MKEDLLHYVWQYKLFPKNRLVTTCGQRVEIIDHGRKNTDAGPDFFNAKIKIGDTLWAGNVEIHIASSDWHRHRHHADERYNSVILHVTKNADCDITSQNGEVIPQMVIGVPEDIEVRYNSFLASGEWIRCQQFWHRLSPEFTSIYLSRMLHERYSRKADAILQSLAANFNNWEETFYVFLARNFGMNVNGLPFEMLAKSLPLSCLGKHSDNLVQVEALLFGQAGLLGNDKPAADVYQATLRQEYAHLSNKFNLTSIDPSLWKFARMRPLNSPYIRIAQFAALIHQSRKLFSMILETDDITALCELFSCRPSAYWDRHYSFGESSGERKKTMGEKSIDILILNTVIPFLFAYSVKKDCADTQAQAYRLLEKIAPEQNSIIEKWKTLGLSVRSAYDTQALLELKKMYCNEKKCLQCGIGHLLLSRKFE